MSESAARGDFQNMAMKGILDFLHCTGTRKQRAYQFQPNPLFWNAEKIWFSCFIFLVSVFQF
jgi:hypothetical protein